MRKVFVVLLVVLSIGAAAMSVYFLLSDKEEQISDTLYDAIPLDAGLIIDIHDYRELCGIVRQNGFWEQLTDIPSIGRLYQEMLFLDSLTQRSAIPLQHIIFSTHPIGKEDMQTIGYLKVENEKTAKGVIEKFKQELSGKATFSDRLYDQVNITDVSFPDEKLRRYNFSCSYRQGIFLFSRSSILLENALRQIVADYNITHKNETLNELIRTAGKHAPANVYINYAQLPRTALTIFHTKHHSLIDPISRYASWTELDLNIKPDMLLLNGFTIMDSNAQWLSAMKSQPSIPISLVDAMPSTTYAFLWVGIKNIDRYFNDYNHYLDQNKETGYKKELDKIKNTYQIDLQKEFTELFENEAALVYANAGQVESEDAAFSIFRIKSTSQAISKLEEWQDLVTKKNNTDPKQDKTELQFDNQLSFTAYRFPFDIPACLLGDVFSGKNSWCVVSDNYIVFGASPANLKKYLHYTALHASLQTDLSYGKLVNHSSARCNLMFYCNPSLSRNYLENILRHDKFKELDAVPNILSRVQAVVYQLNASGNMLYNNLFIKHSSSESTSVGTQTSWESLLDTAISFKPQLVQNHNTNETEVFVQDMANNVYLLNNVGRILWKVKLPEPILSPVYQVDFYRNGKLQMLFNTRNYLYMIDRLGNMVEKYPVKLNSPAVGSVALFDYDNNKAYRMLIACEDRKVYAYDKTGKAIDGWGFRQSEYPVQTDLYHYRVENKDFIVFADKYKVYILDRQGRTRITPQNQFPVGKNTVIALDKAPSLKQSSLVLADTSGTVHFISLADGGISRKEIESFPADYFFLFQDVDGDQNGDFIFTDDKRLFVFRQDGKKILEVDTEEPITLRPYVYEFSATDIRIGIVQPQKNQILLYNNNGKIQKGFPMKGSTLFSIGRLDKTSTQYNLFVGSQNNFLYNYSVK